MPELQKLYEKYKDDKDVLVLTLDSNDEPATVKKFIAEKKYTLPVLIDENYVNKIPQFENLSAYPTTLFIDKFWQSLIRGDGIFRRVTGDFQLAD